MNYTFTEDEIKMFLNWSIYAEGEVGLNEEEKKMVKKLNKIINPSFDELDDKGKTFRFLENNYKFGIVCPAGDTKSYYSLKKVNKNEKYIPVDMEFKKAVKEIVNYFED